jgi:acyl carrier protein
MSDKYEHICNLIARVCDIDKATLKPQVNAVDELGIDSVDWLDIIYEVDREYGIKIPAEDWMAEINTGKATTADYFVLERFVAHVDRLAQAKTTA